MMRKKTDKFRFVIFILFGLCLVGQTSWAETHYVTDVFKTGFRTGPSIKNKIIRFLTSGQPVEPLESNEGWTRVRVLGGDPNVVEEGWVLSRYLINRLPWKDAVSPLKRENVSLKEKLERFEQECNKISQNEQQLKRILEEKTVALQELQRDHETLKVESKDFLLLKKEQEYNRILLKTHEETKRMLSSENEELRLSQRNNWLGMGALILLCGLMIGIAVGKYRRKSTFH